MDSKIYALVGPYASGKRTLLRKIIQLGVHYIPMYTTRVYKEGANLDDINHTITQEEFAQGDFITKVSHQGHYYGMKKKDVLSALTDHKKNIIILQAGAISQIQKLIGSSLVTIYILSDYVTLVSRMLMLGCTNDEIKYQLEYAEDNKEFDSWKLTNYIVKNVGDENVALQQVLAIMGLTALRPADELRELVK